jgi:uncharacterized cofD-like protein
VLSVHGRVLPSTLHNVRLIADKTLPGITREVRVKGESKIAKVSGEVRHVWLEPNSPPAYPGVIKALLSADLIIIGPGSLYTSLIPNLLVPEVVAAIRASQAVKMFVCNVTTQPGETDGYTCLDHLDAIENHIGGIMFDMVVCNNSFEGLLPEGVDWVCPDNELSERYAVYFANLQNPESPGQHEAGKLAKAVIDLLQERTGPLVL